MGTVNYNGKVVSDESVKTVLTRIAEKLGDVNVISGDRNYVPPGGSTTSHHLGGRAADIHVKDLTDGVLYLKLREKKSELFDVAKKYQVIHHGPYTVTEGEHVHIGRYTSGLGVVFMTEGLTSQTKGTYTQDD